jgi:hypothetical protein
VKSALKFVLVLHALSILAQAILAGQFLSGFDAPVRFHELMAWLVLAISLCQLAIAGVLASRSRLPLPVLIAGVVTLLAELFQTVTGYGRFLDVHVPLGVLIFGLLVFQLAGVFGAQK